MVAKYTSHKLWLVQCLLGSLVLRSRAWISGSLRNDNGNGYEDATNHRFNWLNKDVNFSYLKLKRQGEPAAVNLISKRK